MSGSGLPKRKNIRLPDYDYSSNDAYFVTICTKDREPLLGEIVARVAEGDGFYGGPVGYGTPTIVLSPNGQIVDRYINNINVKYWNITVPIYCIMPNHIHLIVVIGGENAKASKESGSPRAATPTVPKIINSLKSLATKEAGQPLWQRGYYEHIIRGEQDYCDIWKYIETNPPKWAEDQYYL